MKNTTNILQDGLAWKKWGRRLVALLLAFLALIATFNIIVDPYEVFQLVTIPAHSLDPNERYRKVEHLIAKKSNINAFLMGTSTMGNARPEDARNACGENLNFYNLSFFAGNPQEALASLKALQKNGVVPEKVVYGIDYFQFHDHTAAGASRWLHPEANGQNKMLFFWKYLFLFSFKESVGKIETWERKVPFIQFDFENTGAYSLPFYDEWLASDEGGYFLEKLPSQPLPLAQHAWDPRQFFALQEMGLWGRGNNVDMRFVLMPVYPLHRTNYSDQEKEWFERKLRDIVDTTVPDSNESVESSQKHAYYDGKHFRQALSQKVLKTACQ